MDEVILKLFLTDLVIWLTICGIKYHFCTLIFIFTGKKQLNSQWSDILWGLYLTNMVSYIWRPRFVRHGISAAQNYAKLSCNLFHLDQNCAPSRSAGVVTLLWGYSWLNGQMQRCHYVYVHFEIRPKSSRHSTLKSKIYFLVVVALQILRWNWIKKFPKK